VTNQLQKEGKVGSAQGGEKKKEKTREEERDGIAKPSVKK